MSDRLSYVKHPCERPIPVAAGLFAFCRECESCLRRARIAETAPLRQDEVRP